MDKNTETEIRELVRKEIMECFKDLQSDVLETKSDIKEIKLALLGDDAYQHKGVIKQLKENTEYINRNKTLDIVERAKPAIEWYEDWSTVNNGYKTSRIELLSEIMSAYSNIKWLIGGIVALGLINIPQSIMTLIELFSSMGK